MEVNLLENLKRNKTIYLLGKIINVIIYNYVIDTFRYAQFKLFTEHQKKYSSNSSLKNIHNNKRCFIVATGPSLTHEDLNKIQGELSFGVNSVIKVLNDTRWKPTYYGIQDANVYQKLEQDIIKSGFKNIFVSDKLKKKFSSAKHFTSYFHFTCFHSKHGDIVPLTSGFSYDFVKGVYDGYSITYSMLQLAVYMGFKEIYLLGTDCNYNTLGKQHFIESGWHDKNAKAVGERMIYAFSIAKKYLDKKGIKVYNATRGGMLEVFERVNLDEIIIDNKK